MTSDRQKSTSLVVRTALLDEDMFTRDCFVRAAFTAQPLLNVTPYQSPMELPDAIYELLDLVIFMDHGALNPGHHAIAHVARRFPLSGMVILTGKGANGAWHNPKYPMHPATVIDVSSKSLNALLSDLYSICYGRMKQGAPSNDSLSEAKRHAWGSLTKRERSVLDLIAQGCPNKQIAEVLAISVSSVKVHVRNILQKTGRANRVQLAVHSN